MNRMIAGMQGKDAHILRMGFDDNILVVRVVNCKPVTAIIDGKRYKFRSIFEFHWACYCQLRKQQGLIKNWAYESIKYDFFQFGYRNRPFEYTPDFTIWRNDGTVYFEETKGCTETKDLSRFLRARKHFDARFELILQRTPRRGKGSQIVAKAQTAWYIDRVVNGSEIIRQCGKQLLLSFCTIVE